MTIPLGWASEGDRALQFRQRILLFSRCHLTVQHGSGQSRVMNWIYLRLLTRRAVHPFVCPLEFRVFFKGGGHLQPCGWGGWSLNFFKWHYYECLNNPISSNLGLCTACCCSINSSLGFTGGKPDQKITILVFKLVVQNFAPPVFFPCFLCYPNHIISPYFLLVVLLLQYVALSLSVDGTSYVLVIINWCRVAISNDKSTLCVPLLFCVFLPEIGCDL